MKLKSQAFSRACWNKAPHRTAPPGVWVLSAEFGPGQVPEIIQLFPLVSCVSMSWCNRGTTLGSSHLVPSLCRCLCCWKFWLMPPVASAGVQILRGGKPGVPTWHPQSVDMLWTGWVLFSSGERVHDHCQLLHDSNRRSRGGSTETPQPTWQQIPLCWCIWTLAVVLANSSSWWTSPRAFFLCRAINYFLCSTISWYPLCAGALSSLSHLVHKNIPLALGIVTPILHEVIKALKGRGTCLSHTTMKQRQGDLWFYCRPWPPAQASLWLSH